MKTPKDILLEQHAEAVPALDRIREQAIAPLRESAPPAQAATPFLAEAWSQLFWQARHIWRSLAAVWAVLLVVTASQPAQTAPSRTVTEAALPQHAAWMSHHNLLRAELGLPAKPQKRDSRPDKPAIIHQSRFRHHLTFA